jgi:Domain of unknown function (DUF4253)
VATIDSSSIADVEAIRANTAEEIAAVVRSWQHRFGARLCALGFGTIGLAGAWPPQSVEHAQRVAAEHFAFCPDLRMTTFSEYAGSLVGNRVWNFWWD